MKTVYKLQNKYFNIKNLKEVSEIKIVNKYDEQELQKKLDKKIDQEVSSFKDIPKVRLYFNYEKDCKEISISIDGVEYTYRNWEIFKNDKNKTVLFSFINDEFKVTKKQQKEFDIFKKEAETLLEAFKKL